VNRLRLRASLTGRNAVRRTPAGLPVIELEMQHASLVVEAGLERNLQFALEAVALGEVALRLEKVAPGTELEVEGFLAPRSRRSSRLRVHVTQFGLVAPGPPAQTTTK
jgi:primosomal replication protein N